MNSTEEFFLTISNPAASIAIAFVVLVLFVQRGYHRSVGGAISRRKLASVFILSAGSYVFGVICIGQLFFSVPISLLISEGFGDQRVTWLLLAVLFDMIFRIWDEWSSR